LTCRTIVIALLAQECAPSQSKRQQESLVKGTGKSSVQISDGAEKLAMGKLDGT
jgi:hypothetical protein